MKINIFTIKCKDILIKINTNKQKIMLMKNINDIQHINQWL